jgi:hypothetical protein
MMRRSALLSLVFANLLFSARTSSAQSYRGEAVPVVARSRAIEFDRLRFLTPTFGHEGPMDAPLRTSPVMGREYFVEADVFGIESAASIRFELVDAAGRSLQTLNLWKASDNSTDGEFYGFVKVPNQSFRAVARGTNTAGAPFRSATNNLVQPAASGPAEQLTLPGGISRNEAAAVQPLMDGYRQELQARAMQSSIEHPDGVITLGRAVVSPITYEPLNSAAGSPIGMRLRYSIRFPTRQTIAAMPHVNPVYQPWDWRGVIEMKPLAGTISPSPQLVGAETLNDVIVYTAAATYEAGTTYTFVIDMIPDYVFQGTQTGRFCVYERKVSNRAVWEAIMGSSTATPYSISIFHTDTSANIPAFFPQRTLHQNFIESGAFDCGPTPNIRF